MTNSISAKQWMDHISSEYLDSYNRQGGSTVKFVVADQTNNALLKDLIREKTSDSGYLSVELDSKDLRFHMQQDIFFSFANQIDWRKFARKYLISKAEEAYFDIGSIDPSDTNVMESIAKLNNLEVGAIARTLRPAIEAEVYRDAEFMSVAFRTAMPQLCQAEFSSNVMHYSAQPVIDWLTGRNPRISGVRSFQIFTPINRNTAKYFFESAMYWLNKLGNPGVLMALDNRRITMASNPRDGSTYYNRAMVMQHYEVLRKWIDSTEKLTSAFILVLVNEDFVNPEVTPRSRSVYVYNALHTRILDDVRGRNQVNPNASLLTVN